MTFKYNTRQFIKEMECRPCLWNVNTAEYNDKGSRESAWVQIAEIMYDEWDELDLDEKAEKVKDLQKKWKGLRDYHTRVHNKKYVPELQLQRGRKRPFLDMLSFLNTKKKPAQGPQNQQPAESNIEPATTKVSSYKKVKPSPASTRKAAPEAATVFRPPAPNLQTRPPPTQESSGAQLNDPDANFLFSILPDMKSMNPSQNFEFRFQVMKMIKDIKYNHSDYYFYNDRGSLMQEQEIEIDPISNESVVSSPEDKKVVLNDSE